MDFPPLYKDLGKAAKDLFIKGFGFGGVKLDVKSKSQSGFEVRAEGSNNLDTGISGGHLETRYKMKDLGLSFQHRWNTENQLKTEVTMEDRLAQGLRLGLDTSFVPNTGKKSATLKTGYRCSYVNAGCDLDFLAAPGAPTLHAAGVLGYQGLLAGYQMTFDAASSQLTQNNFSLGYRAGDCQLLTSVNDGMEFNTSIYQKVNSNLQTAVGLTWTVGSDSSRLGIATRYQLDKDVSLCAKVDNACLVGLGYTQTLRPGVKFTVSALIDGKNFNAGGHKVGMGLEFEG